MKTKINYLLLITAILVFAISCEDRNGVGSDDTTPPGPPSNITYKPLFGGARFFYDVPEDEDVLSVEARYTNADGKTFTFSSSYFVDSLEVFGFGDTIPYTVDLYARDRAGNISDFVSVEVKPLQSAISRVVESLELKPAFSSFFVDWVNELKQSINVYIDFTYTENGEERSFTSVFSSNLEEDRRFVENLDLGPDEPLNVKIRVSDIYGNMSKPVDMGTITLLEDNELPKDDWFLPAANDSIGGVPQAFGNQVEGRLRYVIDGFIDEGENLNFMHTGGRGHTGDRADGNMPWNVIIDLGDHYELSRIVTVQRHTNFTGALSRGQYYRAENVGIYEMYIWDDDTEDWVFVSENKIKVPVGLSELEFVKKGRQGDMAYMYPDEPQYTKPTRWFRYRAMKSFNGNYTRDDANCLSEITLYGRKAN
ncbi:MAG: DUF4959 domain-containing protein [Bacteroidales bacterium]